MVCKFFDKKTRLGASASEQQAEELHKPATNKIKRRNVYAKIKGNIWTTDFSEMESLFSKIKNFKYPLCLIIVFTKYAWVKPLKDKKGKRVFNALLK